jgi:acetyltransferase-like isoleucine patch superfamily enzyme
MQIKWFSKAINLKIIQVYHQILKMRTAWFRTIYGMNLHPTVRISFKARMDKSNPKSVEIHEYTYVTFDTIILSHDFASRKHGGIYEKKTCIGKNCFIGCGSIILPGVTIGDSVIVGAGSVVTKDVPSNCIVAGNPARVIKENISTEMYGRLLIN